MSKDEEMNNIMELTDDEGETIEVEKLLEFEYNDRLYVAFSPFELMEGMEDGEILIYRIDLDGEITGCETEEELDGAFNAFMEAYNENEENADEFETLLEFDYNGRSYAALSPLEPMDDMEDDEVLICRIEQDGGLADCETQEELDGAFKAFLEAYYEDEECGECEGGSCDKCPCACSEEKEKK